MRILTKDKYRRNEDQFLTDNKQTRKYSDATYFEIKKLIDRVKTYQYTIKGDEFKLGAMKRDLYSLMSLRKNNETSEEIRYLTEKIYNVSARLTVDRNFLRDLHQSSKLETKLQKDSAS